MGTFGRVLECLDKQRDRVVAIKVVRRVEKYTESAKVSVKKMGFIGFKRAILDRSSHFTRRE